MLDYKFTMPTDLSWLGNSCNVGYWFKEIDDFGPKDVNLKLLSTKSDELEKCRLVDNGVRLNGGQGKANKDQSEGYVLA